MSNINLSYIVSALKSGFTETAIAGGLGCSVSAVSQAIEEHQLKALAAENSRFKNIDEKYNKLEEKALEKLEKGLEFAVLNPIQACRVINTLNSAKRRSLSEGQTILNQNNTQLVQLNLPERYAPKVVKNDQNEVIEVNDRVYNTMPSSKLDGLQDSRTKLARNKELKYEPVSDKKAVADYL